VKAALIAAAALFVAGAAGRASADPRIDYMLQCRGCHGPQGQGTAGAAPSLRELTPLLVAPGGRAYLVGVPGVSRSALDDAATAALLNWIVTEFARDGVPADFVPFSTVEVSAHRRPPLIDPAAVRARVLSQHP